MFPALDMELEIVRTVLKNKVNDIYVCTDLLKDTGSFYTLISIRDKNHRKIITEKLNTERIFFSNRDFIGSFTYENCLNLVFRYYHENLLSLMGGVYIEEFVDCKKTAVNLITAYAESGAGTELGMLLLNDRNININADGDISLNYFMDFAQLQQKVSEEQYLKSVAQAAFGVLEQNYKGRLEGPDDYPGDLRLFYLKMVNGGFSSFGHMIALIRGMADKPIVMKGLGWWLTSRFHIVKNFLFRNSMTTFLTILVIVTLIYAGVQIRTRWVVHKAYENNVRYYGIEYIGSVYLGDEE